MKLADILLSSLLFVIPLFHLVLSPYTKVEESFSLQATHDILVYGLPTANITQRLSKSYDHFEFPGAVPRTFLGPVVLAGLSQPVLGVVGFQHAQLVVRAILGVGNGAALLVFKNVMRSSFGDGAARWWTLLIVTQFHLMYYLTRLLPNMFSFGLTTVAAAFLLPSSPDPKGAVLRSKRAIGLLVFSAAIFRSETAILLATTGLQLLLTGQLSFRALFSVFLGTFLAAVLITVPLDSYFWQKPLWPELWGFYFNAVLGSSSEWGVSSWHYYFTSALPRLLVNPLGIPLLLYSFSYPILRSQTLRIAAPSLAFIAIYSLQPHKEARFIFYAVPSLTAAVATAANYISNHRSKSLLYRLAFLFLVLSIPLSFAISTGMLLLSSLNYPGGDAVSQLFAVLPYDYANASYASLINSSPVFVHADVLTCMTGLTLFHQNPLGFPLQTISSPPYKFDKTEKDLRLGWPKFWLDFDYLLMEDTSLALGKWEILGWTSGFDGIELLRPGQEAVSRRGPGGSTRERIVPKQQLKESEDDIGEQRSKERWQIRGGRKGDMTFCNGCSELGRGAIVAALRDRVRALTGGWWLGPRMTPKVYIMKRVEDQQGTA